MNRAHPAKTRKLESLKGRCVSLGAVTVFCPRQASGKRIKAKLSFHSQGQFFDLRMKIV